MFVFEYFSLCGILTQVGSGKNQSNDISTRFSTRWSRREARARETNLLPNAVTATNRGSTIVDNCGWKDVEHG